MNDVFAARDLSITVARGFVAIQSHLPQLQRLAAACGQPGTMHGLELLLGSQFARRKRSWLICFHHEPSRGSAATELAGAILLQEYRILGLPVGVFATADPFGVRTVVGPGHLHAELCLRASHFVLDAGGRLVLTTWRSVANTGRTHEASASLPTTRYLHASAARTVQDTLRLGNSAEETLQSLGKRTRVHMRAARRRFDETFPQAQVRDATAWLTTADDAELRQLNEAALDVIEQAEFNHQVRSLCGSAGAFVLGLELEGTWIALVGGWRQEEATWIEWQCNGRGFEKFSLGSVLRTYLFEEEARRQARNLSFHGGTSHSMLHRFQHTPVADLLTRRAGPVTGMLVRLVPWACRRWPRLLLRGNFLFNALSTPGLRWSFSVPSSSEAALPE